MDGMAIMNDALNTAKKSQTGVSVFGLGYVGLVSTACFAKQNFNIIGIDVDEDKVAKLNLGKSPIVEPGLDVLLTAGVDDGNIEAISNVEAAIQETDISLVCVGTPSAEDGSCDLTYLRGVSRSIGEALKHKAGYHLVVFRSTIPPGTTSRILTPIIEGFSGKLAGQDFGVCFHPEFLREGTAINDFFAPPKTVIGTSDKKAGQLLAKLYDGVDDKIIFTTIEVAEMVKYVDNTWHALKVSFGNEIGKICKASDVDSHAVMDIFVQDTKLNLSPYYLKPGFAFGGSCLPKDVRGITHLAERANVETPVLNSILKSNQAQIDHAINLIESKFGQRVGFLGLTFKAHTDDLRESPILPVIAEILEKGYQVKIYDPNLNLDTSIRHHLQHAKHAEDKVHNLMARLPELICTDLNQICDESDTLIISHGLDEYAEAALNRRDDQNAIDLVRLFSPDGASAKIKASGFNDYLQKPVNHGSLLDKLEAWAPAPNDRNTRVLLVDDDPVMHIVVRGMLTRKGFDIETVASGKEALEVLKMRWFDIALLDLAMPEMDGFETAMAMRTLSERTTKLPIVAFTANAAPEQSQTYEGICW